MLLLRDMINGVLPSTKGRLKSLKLFVALLVGLSVIGCAGPIKLLEVQKTSVPIKILHPALPPAVYPIPVDPIILTPGITKIWNGEVAKGKRLPYTVFGFNEQTWLSLGQYDEELLTYIQKLLAIIKQYGNPALQTSAPKLSKAATK